MRKPLATVSDGTPCPPIASDESLLADGWRRRYLADRVRANEAREMYSSLGFDVLLRKPQPSHVRSECDGCRQVACSEYFIVYTRRREQS